MTGPVTNCGLCGSSRLRLILDLGEQPAPERMESNAERYPLRLVRCGDCDLVQLDYIAPQDAIFGKEHPYASGNSPAMREHFHELAWDHRYDDVRPDELIVDLGCNDGTLLSMFGDVARRVGVEPTNQIAKLPESARGYKDFFTAELAKRIVAENGLARYVFATNVLAHCPDPHDFLEGVRILLGADGIFITENHDVARVLEGQWDTVYHEHLRYYSPETLTALLEMHGLQPFGLDPIATHGGSFRVQAAAMRVLQDDADWARDELRLLLCNIKAQGGTVYGIGATTRATTLIHFAGLEGLIDCVCEVSSSEKIGHPMPGTEIPVVDENELLDDAPSHALLFSWHLRDSIVPSLRARGYEGDIIVPLPHLQTYSLAEPRRTHCLNEPGWVNPDGSAAPVPA